MYQQLEAENKIATIWLPPGEELITGRSSQFMNQSISEDQCFTLQYKYSRSSVGIRETAKIGSLNALES